MKTETMSFGRSIEYRRTLPHPERTAMRSASGHMNFDVVFRVWPNRASMTKTIRMQQQRESQQTDWKAIVPLTDTEGF